MRVVVADDAVLVREGIASLLRSSGADVVAQSGDADHLLRDVRMHQPDVAVVDIKIPPTHTDEGLVAAQRIREEEPDVGVLVLSQYLEPAYAMRLIAEHPEKVGYLLKERVFSGDVLVDALQRIRDGETVVDPTIVSMLFGRRRRQDPLRPQRPAAGGARPGRRGTVQPGDRRPALRDGANRGSARGASLHQAAATGVARRPPAGACRPHVPAHLSVGATRSRPHHPRGSHRAAVSIFPY